MHTHAESLALPSFVLTVPTPQPAPSPILVPHSPFTPHKFVAAASTATASVFAERRPAPVLPRCSHVSENMEEGMCAACELQMLACKVWYQGSDGGRRQALREPYIRPGESNANNRAMMESLGFPAGVGLGLAGADGDSEGCGERTDNRRQALRSFLKRYAPAVPVNLKPRRQSLGKDRSERENIKAPNALKSIAAFLRWPRTQATPSVLGENARSAADDLSAGRPTSFLALDSHESGSYGFETESPGKTTILRLWRRRVSTAMQF
ncbi:hypothetical protein DENSPDRAFT_356947 [Dentipellis sp. KUC8613]|nr:hypothetical protein DENSPDRAFT_356947 [Dentipellis sp. KUC8613]